MPWRYGYHNNPAIEPGPESTWRVVSDFSAARQRDHAAPARPEARDGRAHRTSGADWLAETLAALKAHPAGLTAVDLVDVIGLTRSVINGLAAQLADDPASGVIRVTEPTRSQRTGQLYRGKRYRYIYKGGS